MTSHLKSSIITNVVRQGQFNNADVAELADAQDLKSCGRIIRAGSIPAICTRIIKSKALDISRALLFLIPKINAIAKIAEKKGVYVISSLE